MIYNRYNADSKYQNNILEFKPVKQIIETYMSKGKWISPYQNVKTNGINEYIANQRNVFGVLWTPPRDPSEVSTWLKKLGIKATYTDTQASFWTKNKKAIANLSSEIVISIAFNSGGIGKTKGYTLYEIISVHFEKWISDLIITVEIKNQSELKNKTKIFLDSLNRKSCDIIFTRAWAMPSHYSHTIKPIKELIERVISGKFSIDPFSGMSRMANITNDIDEDKPAMFHLGAVKFLNIWELGDDVRIVIFDPMFSMRQCEEMYEKRGLNRILGVPFSEYWQDVKGLVADLEPDIIIFHGWNTNIIPGYEVKEILMVAHGGWHNDTQITIAQRVVPKTYYITTRLPKEFNLERPDNRALARVVLSEDIDTNIRAVSLECLDLDQGALERLYLEMPRSEDEIKEKLVVKMFNLAKE